MTLGALLLPVLCNIVFEPGQTVAVLDYGRILVDIRSVMPRNVLGKPNTFYFSLLVVLLAAVFTPAQELTVADVERVIAQAVSKAASMNAKITVSVTDDEGNLLGTFVMTGAPTRTRS